MALISYKEKTRTRRFATKLQRAGKLAVSPKKLKVILKKHSGRSHGTVTVRHQGGRHKRNYRIVDFKRDKFNVTGSIVGFEYDPNRNVDVALVKYSDGDYRYILAAKGQKVGDSIVSAERSEVSIGNTMKLKNMPVGTIVHNVELFPGSGGKIARSAGNSVTVIAKQSPYAHLKLPSGEVRMVPLESLATVGVLGNEEWKNMNFGKAGRKRHMGIRPHVRGTAMDPESHAHGGGEGRSGIGRKRPMTVYGRAAVGRTRKRDLASDKYIVKRRK